MENNERNFQNGVNDVEQSKNRSKKNGKGATKFLVTIVVIFALIAGILIGVLIVKDGNVQIVNKNNESEKTVSKNENEGKSDEKEESKEVAQEKDYSKYLGMWSNNEGEFEVKNVSGNQITFTWFLYRLTSVDDTTLEFVDGKAEFYYEGYNDSNFDGKYTDDEKFMRKATIELKDYSIVAVVKEVSSIDKSAKLLEFGGSVYLEPGSYVYEKGNKAIEKNSNDDKNANVTQISLNGSYERPDYTERTSGNLEIKNFSKDSIDFELNATHINGENIEESIARGGVNIGEVTGKATKIDVPNEYVVPDSEQYAYQFVEDVYGQTCKITFVYTAHKMFEDVSIIEEYSDGVNPYAGAGVSFAGEYEKVR